MSDYGLLEEVRITYRGSVLVEDAAVSDTDLVVEYGGDFNYDPEDSTNSGGTLELNGAQLAYVSIAFGELPEDPDTLILAEPLAVAADAEDSVRVVAGGQIAEDWVAYVTMGEGDQVVVPLSVDQRDQWPPGVYDDPVPVIVSDNLLHIEDAPGRTAVQVSAVEFRNTDTATITDPVGDQPILLTYEPRVGSEHVHWHPKGFGGIHLPASAWSRSGRLVTVEVLAGQAVDDLFTCEYSYFPGQRGPMRPTITSPGEGELVGDTTPTITGTGEIGYPIAVEVDGVSVGSATVGSDGTWSVTVGSALAPGGHVIEATEGSVGTATSDFTTAAPTPPTPSLVGFTAPGTWDSGATTLSYAMPAGTAAGDLLVLTIRGAVAPGGGEVVDGFTCTDPRMTLAFAAASLNGGHPVMESIWLGIADGSGDPILVDLPAGTVDSGNGILAAITGANGWGAIGSVESGTTTPIVGGVAAVAVTWIRGASFTTVTATPPDGYTNISSTGASYASTDLSLWYDAGGASSPAGTFTGEGCCVIAIV